MIENSALLAWVQAATSIVAIVVAVAAIFAAFRIPIAQHKIERWVVAELATAQSAVLTNAL